MAHGGARRRDARPRRGSGGGTSMSTTAQVVPRARPESYYGQPVINQPVWTWQIPWYFFFGGTAGACAPFALACQLGGHARLARRAWLVSIGALAVSPPLLIADLGRPRRFFNMLRLFKLSSPMSVGSWVLTGFGLCVAPAASRSTLGWPVRLGRAGAVGAAALGPALATYTAVLLADTAVPAWHEARGELPFVFAGSAAASAGAAVTLVSPANLAAPARRMAVFGALVELLAVARMERRLGRLAAPYREDPATRPFARAARGLTTAGAVLMAAGGGRRRGDVLGAAALLAGSVCQRWAVFRAGFASARDPAFTVGPQRERISGAAT
ncbi:MAG: polysulfide reductase [Solirubrobacterales bacterium]|nr:MAG: polysulfide reductase [Solirubrobacterales bacterium]